MVLPIELYIKPFLRFWASGVILATHSIIHANLTMTFLVTFLEIISNKLHYILVDEEANDKQA